MSTTKNSDERMLQAEIGGGGRIDPLDGIQRPGYVIRDFSLPTIFGDRLRISDYRGRANLVLFFLGSSSQGDGLIEGLFKRKQELADEGAVVIVIAPHMPGSELQEMAAKLVLILVDEDAKVHRKFGAIDQQGQAAPVIYITDKFGEIISTHSGLHDQKLPSVSEMMKTLEFINHQCPECEAPEWPR